MELEQNPEHSSHLIIVWNYLPNLVVYCIVPINIGQRHFEQKYERMVVVQSGAPQRNRSR